MRITESRLRRIIRGMIAESIGGSGVDMTIKEKFNNAFRNMCEDDDTFGRGFDYYSKIKKIIEYGGNYEDEFKDRCAEIGISDECEKLCYDEKLDIFCSFLIGKMNKEQDVKAYRRFAHSLLM